jgi:hypothetical protein
MASWAAVLALTGFHYSAVTREMGFGLTAGRHFWSSGYAWGSCTVAGDARKGWTITLSVAEGEVRLASVRVGDSQAAVSPTRSLTAGESITVAVGPA